MPCLDNITNVPRALVEYRLRDAVVKGYAALIRVRKPVAKFAQISAIGAVRVCA